VHLYQYQTQVSDKAEDPEWDAFLVKTPGGHYTQTSLWAQAKSILGWCAVRVVVSQRNQIVAGAQLLTRSLPVAGIIGFVPGGPLVVNDDPGLTQLVMAQLHQVTKDHRVQYLLVQPRFTNEVLAQGLLGRGYRPSSHHPLAISTALLDLTQDLNHILSAMRKSTRHNIRLSQRKGVIVREGSESDLPIFYRLEMATCKRKNISTFSEEYYTRLWKILHPYGYLRMFIAEYAGEAVSASLVIPFGNTVTDTIGAWSGRHGKAHPNELLEWAAITWAKSQGYSYFDFDGITPEVARGELAPDAHREGDTFFKLGFGGEVVLCPVAYEYLPNPFLRWVYMAIEQKIANGPEKLKVVNFIRGIGSS
jgi:peptidoglycan pentaglycine glycine transferase (the first glycine)